MPQYIRYYIQKSIVNLTKTMKADLKTILSPLLVEYYEKSKTTTDVASSVYVSEEDTVTFASVNECGIGDNSGGVSAQEV